jgi:3-hydroxy-9,10-secoandrosta-1,3,5(10)-triene-9,17-dione monooxygenase reductase component
MHDIAGPDRTQAFRSTMGRLPTGVSVITTRTPDGPVGITVSAVASLSLDPLQLLICVSNHLFTRTALEAHGRFGVSVLGEDGEDLARRFAASRPDKFAGVRTIDVSEVLPGGDHAIFVGDVRHFEHRQDCRPLLFFAGAFHALTGSAAATG